MCRVPAVMETHGKPLVMENGQKIYIEIENILKSLNFSTAYRESRMRSSDNSISRPIALLQ